MTWDEICADPRLRDLPYKIETNQQGQIIMSPARGKHGVYQGEVTVLLSRLMPEGLLGGDLSLQTDDGVKVPDVAWMSFDYYDRQEAEEGVYPESPEIVVEILSESNTRAEMREKAKLFFSRGSREFWIVERDGRVRFFTDVDQEVAQSPMCPEFPTQLQPGRRR